MDSSRVLEPLFLGGTHSRFRSIIADGGEQSTKDQSGKLQAFRTADDSHNFVVFSSKSLNRYERFKRKQTL